MAATCSNIISAQHHPACSQLQQHGIWKCGQRASEAEGWESFTDHTQSRWAPASDLIGRGVRHKHQFQACKRSELAFWHTRDILSAQVSCLRSVTRDDYPRHMTWPAVAHACRMTLAACVLAACCLHAVAEPSLPQRCEASVGRCAVGHHNPGRPCQTWCGGENPA